MRQRLSDPLPTYLLAAGVTAVAVGARWVLDPWLGDFLALVTMFAAVAGVVWQGGYRPAILAAVLGYLACDFLFIPPRGAIGPKGTASLVGLVAYVVSCSLLIGLGEATRRARARASAGQDLLRVTLASIGDAVITTDTEGRVAYLNRVAESLTGWSEAEAVGRPLDAVFRIISEGTRRPVESPAARALREGVVVGLANHTLLIGRDGTERPVDDSAAPIRDDQGRIVGCVLVFRDVTERRRVGQALARSERDLADFFDNASVGLHWVGPDGTILRANQAELDLLGYAPDEYLGRDIADFHVDREVIADILARLTRGETVRECPARLRCKDGSVREVMISSSALFEDGRFIHTRCFTIDVTERRRAEGARAHLAALVTTSDDAIVSKGLDGTILSWNAGAERLFGYAAAEAVGRSINLIIPPELRGEAAAILERLRRGERVEHFETVRVTRDGRRVDISLSVSPIRDDAGRVVAASKVARDITARKLAEQALADAERQLRLVTNHAPVMIAHCDAEGRYKFVNAPYAEWFGLGPDGVIGRRIPEVLGEQAHAAIRPYLDQALAGSAVEFDIELPHRAGGSHFLRCAYRPECDAEGRVVGLVGAIINITERRRMEEALREADRRKDEFLATLAHELRNPLAPVRNSLEIMKRVGGDAGLVERALGTMDRQVAVMERLIDDLLDISRINRNRLELRRRTVDLASVVHDAVEACRPLAERSRHDVAVTLPPEPVYLNGDPVRLAQVFSNLLNNACKYTGPGGRIRLTAQRCAGEVVVSVKDNGIGIPREMLPRVFEMFAQVDQTLERSHGGLGIGLTLVRQLVELHGGRVEARSDGPGLGSELVVTLPVVERSPETERPAAAAPPQAPKRRILVADDHRDGAESLALLLNLAGHETEVAYDGLSAVEVAERFRPDVALLDIGMPKLNGYDACRRIRDQEWGRGMVLVAVTGWGQDEDRRRTKAAGFDAHLVKPVDHADLTRLLAALPNGSSGGA